MSVSVSTRDSGKEIILCLCLFIMSFCMLDSIVSVHVLFALFSSNGNCIHIFSYLVIKLEIRWLYQSPTEKGKDKKTRAKNSFIKCVINIYYSSYFHTSFNLLTTNYYKWITLRNKSSISSLIYPVNTSLHCELPFMNINGADFD